MDSKYQETFKSWNNVTKQYEDIFMDLDLYTDTYTLFCNSIFDKNAHILEVGCGPGNVTQHLIAQQSTFKITAIDVSENMVIRAKQLHPSVDFKIMDCRNIYQLSSCFNGIISGFTIPYLSKEDCANFIKNAGNLLLDNGILYLSFVHGDYSNSGYITGSTGDRMYFYYHNLTFIKNELEKHSFTITNLIEKEYQKSDASTEIHTIVIAQK